LPDIVIFAQGQNEVALKVSGYELQNAAEVLFGCKVDHVTVRETAACWCSLGHDVQILLRNCL